MNTRRCPAGPSVLIQRNVRSVIETLLPPVGLDDCRSIDRIMVADSNATRDKTGVRGPWDRRPGIDLVQGERDRAVGLEGGRASGEVLAGDRAIRFPKTDATFGVALPREDERARGGASAGHMLELIHSRQHRRGIGRRRGRAPAKERANGGDRGKVSGSRHASSALAEPGHHQPTLVPPAPMNALVRVTRRARATAVG